MAGSNNTASIVDYIVCTCVLLVSLSIGIFYSFRQKTTTEYVHGSHKMDLIPVSISMVVSFISAITVQGVPAEVYMYGIEVAFMLIGISGILIVNITFLPIFYELKPTTVYDYLELRYKSKYPKLLGSILELITMTFYSGIILFGPAAALESLIGIPTGYNIIAMASICTIYTSIGGIKAVIWTDVFQGIIMVLGLVIILIVGFININNDSIWSELEKHGRTSLNLDPSLFQRNSVWIFAFIQIITKTVVFSNQSAMVRYTSLPTINKARLSTFIALFGYVLLQGLSVLVGVVVFVYYSQEGCGPMASGKVYTPNQIIPFFVVEVVTYPGLSGLFISAIVASTLSSVSSAQNSVGTIIWKIFFMKINFINQISERKKIVFLKIVVFILGLVTTSIAFGAMYAGGTLYQAGAAILGVVGAPPFGMFLLGGCFTFVSGAAAVIGCLVTTAFCAWLSLGKIFYGTLWIKPTLIDETCAQALNITYNYTSPISNFDDTTLTSHYMTYGTEPNEFDDLYNHTLLKLFSISSYAYPLIGVGGTFIIGLLLSLFPCLRYKEEVDEILLIPPVRRCVKKSNLSKKNSNCNYGVDIVLIPKNEMSKSK